jgi:L1 cell adhesion molecule like protein
MWGFHAPAYGLSTFTCIHVLQVYVTAGIILKNENKSGEMVNVMTHLHQYVRTVCTSQERTISTGQTVQEESTSLRPILVGGDQLTAARARSAIKSKMNGQTHTKTLSGIVPVAEDWHTKANFLGVSYRVKYSM